MKTENSANDEQLLETFIEQTQTYGFSPGRNDSKEKEEFQQPIEILLKQWISEQQKTNLQLSKISRSLIVLFVAGIAAVLTIAIVGFYIFVAIDEM